MPINKEEIIQAYDSCRDAFLDEYNPDLQIEELQLIKIAAHKQTQIARQNLSALELK